jgi:Ca-activated chloride channel family protein
MKPGCTHSLTNKMIRETSPERWKVSALCLVVGGLIGSVGCSSSGQLIKNEDSTIRLNVNLIELNASVVDEAGKPVLGLDRGDFRLFVDGVSQPITVFERNDAPVAAGLVIDNSASMARKGPEVLAAALAFARASNPLDQMFVVHFNGQIRFGLPASQLFTGDISELEKALSHFSAEGTTALYDAVAVAISRGQKARLQRKVLLLISDGGDNSSGVRFQEVLDLAKQSDVVIYCLGIFDEHDADRNPHVLAALADATGGEALFPKEAKEATNICVTIARDIRQQYQIGFAGSEDGRYHRIDLTVHDPSGRVLSVRTRAGYFAPNR